MAAAIRYQIRFDNPRAHLIHVSLSIARPDPAGQQLSLPSWTPGSYLIREHARQIIALTAVDAQGKALAVKKQDKNRWQLAACASAVTVNYAICATDDSVRAAWLNDERGYYDGAALYLCVEGQRDVPHAVSLTMPQDWQLATTLPGSEGEHAAGDYATLIDHPVMLGKLKRIEFSVGDVPHALVLQGAEAVDEARLATDLAKVCEQHAQLFGLPLPMDRYAFLTRVTANGYGGLEHQDCSSLLITHADLPGPGQAEISPGYRNFLGLVSHEYFHLWNVRRIRPQAFAASDLSAEAYTRDLWAYEGITSYYDDLALLRCGVISVESYLDLLARAATRLWRTPGRHYQSLADSSFDAWIRFYRADAHSPNYQVSYYNKGALVALCLDLQLRLRHSELSLDEAMRALWQRYGQAAAGAPEGSAAALAAELGGTDITDFLQPLLQGTEDPPLAALLGEFGIASELRCAAGEADAGGVLPAGSCALPVTLGLRSTAQHGQRCVGTVWADGPAQQAGLQPGDVLLALDGWQLGEREPQAFLSSRAPGDVVQVSFLRDARQRQVALTLAAPQPDTWVLRLDPDADAQRCARRRAWLGH